MADIWSLYDKLDGERAQCKKCPKTISCKGGSTSGLLRHGVNVHNFRVKRRIPESVDQPEDVPSGSKQAKSSTSKQSTIEPFIHKKPMNEMVARLAAQDGLTISAITNSKFIRTSFAQRGYQLPLSKTSVMKLIHDYYEIAKQQTVQQIQDKLAELHFLSITLDEWTSSGNRKYLNVNVHFGDGAFFNLGLVRVKGSFPAEKILEAVDQHLECFAIRDRNVAAATSDAAKVMEKFGKLATFKHQLCFNHGLHLAVCDVIFKSSETPGDLLEESDSDDEDCDSEESDDSKDATIPGLYNSSNYRPVLLQIRNICKLFRRSPVKNAILQKKVVQEFGKPLQLILDVKTRWNSTEQMLARYMKLHGCVAEALKELEDLAPVLTSNLESISQLYDALQPVRVVSERLGKRDANLLTAESSLNFLVAKLEKLNSAVSRQILDAVRLRINQRRNIGITSLIKFLNNPNDWESNSAFPLLSRSNLFKFVKEDCLDLIKWHSDDVNGTNAAESDSDLQAEPKSIQDELAAFINGKAEGPSNKQSTTKASKSSIIHKELTLFEITGELTFGLKSLFNGLKSIKPTSTDSERVFADAANICTKKRTSLADKSIHVICFLKSFFQTNV
ncbi:uncharacterized protein LOC120430261 [Culex pipiens pallens]|uniref:uncharacterized protein LOC120430261 n=1 Tax=Culex pipiens pallens TaxID=42434 RepID=UPI0019545E24|nr:uncharacterized protein LOC120430261 [Culex pipiens pallens]